MGAEGQRGGKKNPGWKTERSPKKIQEMGQVVLANGDTTKKTKKTDSTEGSSNGRSRLTKQHKTRRHWARVGSTTVLGLDWSMNRGGVGG